MFNMLLITCYLLLCSQPNVYSLPTCFVRFRCPSYLLAKLLFTYGSRLFSGFVLHFANSGFHVLTVCEFAHLLLTNGDDEAGHEEDIYRHDGGDEAKSYNMRMA